jgi:predicted AlkP superfamily pyrophosphatase or phosphodiesterase
MSCYPENPQNPRLTRRPLSSPVICVLLAVAAVAASGCSAKYIRSAPAVAARPLPAESVSRNVVVVSIDGLRPDAINAYGASTLQRLMREGSYTLAASTIHPSKTLPSHTSMLTGQPPERHGVLWNNVATADAESIDLPNVFGLARSHGYSTAAFFSKAKFQPLQVEGTLDYSQAPGGWFGRWSSERTVGDVENYLKDAQPNVLFVHLSDADAAGHSAGWMTPEYGRGVLAADRAVGQLIALAEQTYGSGNFSMIVTADHGGHGTNHGSDDPQDVTIPWIAWGRGVKPGVLPEATIRTMDTAATVLWLLNVDGPSDWAGQPIIGAYTPVAAIAAGG